MSPSETRILVVGKTGAGTSSTGNTILGRKAFTSVSSFSSFTSKCEKQSSSVAYGTVTVVDSPNFFHSALMWKDLKVEMEQGVKCSSGLHALLLILKPETFTEQEVDFVALFNQTFGVEAWRYTMVLFTHGDKLHRSELDQLVHENRRLQKLLEWCGGRYHTLNNNDTANTEQVTQLLQKIDEMVLSNRNSCYTLEMFHHAHSLRVFWTGTMLAVWRVKPQYFYMLCVILLAMGGIKSRTEGSADVLMFTHGFLTGALSALAGAFSLKLCIPMIKKRLGHHQSRVKMFGVSCGFVAGGIIGGCLGSRELLLTGLAGLAGATGGVINTCIMMKLPWASTI